MKKGQFITILIFLIIITIGILTIAGTTLVKSMATMEIMYDLDTGLSDFINQIKEKNKEIEQSEQSEQSEELKYTIDWGKYKYGENEETYNNNVNEYSQEELDEINEWWENHTNIIQE